MSSGTTIVSKIKESTGTFTTWKLEQWGRSREIFPVINCGCDVSWGNPPVTLRYKLKPFEKTLSRKGIQIRTIFHGITVTALQWPGGNIAVIVNLDLNLPKLPVQYYKAVNFGDDWEGKEIVLFDEMLPNEKFVVESDGVSNKTKFDNPVWQDLSAADLEIKILNQIFYLDSDNCDGWEKLD